MLHLAVVILLTACPSIAHIWENTKSATGHYHERFQAVPPDHVTAKKLMHYFLSRPDWGTAVKSGRVRRQAPPDPEIKFDVAFLIDGSASLSTKSFARGLDALRLMVPKARPSTLYAAVTFSDNATAQFDFVDDKSAQKNLQRLKTTQEKGMTNTQAALWKAAELFLNESWGARDEAYKRVLIVTDGQSNIKKESTLYNAWILKTLGVEIFVVAVGRYVKGMVELAGLASSTSAHLYRVANTAGLLRVVRLIPDWKDMKDVDQKSYLSSMYSDRQ